MTNGSALANVGTPVFEIAVDVSGLDLEVRVNDVPVMRVPGGHVETAFDVNPHVVTGVNQLGAIVRPPRGGTEYPPGAQCEIELRVRAAPSSSVAEERGKLVFTAPEIEADTAFSGSTTPEGAQPVVQVGGDDVVRARIPVMLSTPFPPWSWLTADGLTDDSQTFDEVVDQTRTLWGLIQSKDVPALEAASAEQARDWQTAYYLPDEAAGQKMLGIAATLGDPDVQPQPFPDPGSLRLEILGYGKLAHIVDEDGKGPITLGVKGVPTMTGRFNVILCRRDGAWTMIR